MNLTDVYGQWEKDLFFAHLKIYLKLRNESEKFNKSWKSDKTKTETFEVRQYKVLYQFRKHQFVLLKYLKMSWVT